MTEKITSSRFWILLGLIGFAALTRALPYMTDHLWNFTAVGALAIFAGAQYRNTWLAFIVPLATMVVSDLFINKGVYPVVYVGFVLMVICGWLIRKNRSVENIAAASFGGALVFFLMTNIPALHSPISSMYPHTFEGLMQSYIAALPFFGNMLVSNFFFGALLFGAFNYLERKYPQLALN